MQKPPRFLVVRIYAPTPSSFFQAALGGNSRTAMVVTVCPTTLNVDETLFALQFAARARNVSLGPTHRNVGAKNLLEETKELRAKLREAGRKKVQYSPQ